MRNEDELFWRQAKQAIQDAEVRGEGKGTVFDTRCIAVLRQLVHREVDRHRVIAVVEGLAAGFYDLRTPKPQLVMNLALDRIIDDLLSGENDIKETARRLNHTIYRESQGVQERLWKTYPELYGDHSTGDTESGDR
jgi:hypothetical protein